VQQTGIENYWKKLTQHNKLENVASNCGALHSGFAVDRCIFDDMSFCIGLPISPKSNHLRQSYDVKSIVKMAPIESEIYFRVQF